MRPGELLKAGLTEMRKYLAGRSGADTSWSEGQVLAYLNQVVLASKTQRELGERNSRELRTLAELLDALLAGDLAKVGDLAMQRFQAIEMAVHQGTWAQARHVEVIPTGEASLANTWVKDRAAKEELRHVKLKEALDNARKKHHE